MIGDFRYTGIERENTYHRKEKRETLHNNLIIGYKDSQDNYIYKGIIEMKKDFVSLQRLKNKESYESS